MEKAKTPKKPPPPSRSRLAGNALVETIDGPTPILTLVGKVMPVTTRFPDGRLGFRMMINIREISPDESLITLRNEDGQSVTVGVEHQFLQADGNAIAATDVVVGTELDAGWSYPAGYVIPDAPEYAAHLRGKPFAKPIRVVSVEDGGRGPVYGATVKQTASYYLTFGACSLAQMTTVS